ncbi:MAG: hypothetical protein PF518_03190, partial [Spirochaetaceae bacterium]|nr:hypothetical protein [Spirochaetaceae bacterium]
CTQKKKNSSCSGLDALAGKIVTPLDPGGETTTHLLIIVFYAVLNNLLILKFSLFILYLFKSSSLN